MEQSSFIYDDNSKFIYKTIILNNIIIDYLKNQIIIPKLFFHEKFK